MSLSSDCSFEVRRYGSKGPYVSHCDCEWVIDDKGPKSSRLPYNWGLEHLRGFGKSLPKIIGKISLMSGNVDSEDDSDSEAEAESAAGCEREREKEVEDGHVIEDEANDEDEHDD